MTSGAAVRIGTTAVPCGRCGASAASIRARKPARITVGSLQKRAGQDKGAAIPFSGAGAPLLRDGALSETSHRVKAVVCYISGHGFGHAVRMMEVLRALWTRRPDLAVAIRTPAPRWLFDIGLHGPFAYGNCRLDIGAVQCDSLSIDEEATLRAYAEITARTGELVGDEVDAIGNLRPALIFADIPALAFDIATRLGVPSVAMTNFSWDWIYEDYVRDFPRYAGVVATLRRSYSKASLLLRLPFHGDLSAFPRVRDIPLVARKAVLPAAEVRRRVALPQQERIVLLSFGGIGLSLAAGLPTIPGVTFLTTQSGMGNGAPAGCRLLTNAQMTAAGVRYEDLVGACDTVMTKPGYGIVSDCLANGTPMIYTDRGRFAEYPHLVRGIEAHLPHAFLSQEDLYAHRWAPALDAVFAQPRQPPTVNRTGAMVAAEALLEFLGP